MQKIYGISLTIMFICNNGNRLKSECADTFGEKCRHIETKVLALFAKSVSTLKKRICG